MLHLLVESTLNIQVIRHGNIEHGMIALKQDAETFGLVII